MAETYQEGQPVTAAASMTRLLECAFDRTSLAQTRGELGRCGSAHGLVDLALSNFVLAVNEIMTNAVRYAGGRGTVTLWRDHGSLRCHVNDRGSGIPAR